MIELNTYAYIKQSQQTDFTSLAKELLLLNQKEKTWTHVLAVSDASIQLAKKYNVDESKAYQAALLHDISAIIKPNDMLEIASENGFNLDESEVKYPFLLHQKISALIARSYFKITDVEVLNAIACHTTLKANPSSLEMIIFLSDKIVWDQEGQPPYLDDLNKHLNNSLESACQFYLNYLFDNNQLLLPHQDIIKAYKYFNK